MNHSTRLKKGVIGRITTVCTVDLRALALLRIGLACVIIIDLTMGALDFRAFFTDRGLLPIELLLTYFPGENGRAFHSISGAYRRQLTLLIANYMIALALLIGRKSRLMHLLAWAFYCSLSARNPLINSGAEMITRMLLFWSMFLPTHIRRSVDRKNKQKPTESSFFSRASMGLVVQIASIYLRNSVIKTDPQRNGEFTAIYTTLSIDMLRTSVGTRLYQFPGVMKLMTQTRFLLERWGILLFFVPRKQHRRRLVACVAFIIVHIGMALTMKLGYFPRVCVLAWIVLVPNQFRSSLFKPTKKTTNKPYRTRSYSISAFLIVCILYITVRNLRTTDFEKRATYFPETINKYGFLLRLDQYWNMFAPYPLEEDGWFIISGKTAKGTLINLLESNKPVSYEKPTDFDHLYPGEKRRKLFLNFRNSDFALYRGPYLHRQCRTRNQNHPHNTIHSASMEYVVEQTKPDYEVETGKIVMLHRVDCE